MTTSSTQQAKEQASGPYSQASSYLEMEAFKKVRRCVKSAPPRTHIAPCHARTTHKTGSNLLLLPSSYTVYLTYHHNVPYTLLLPSSYTVYLTHYHSAPHTLLLPSSYTVYLTHHHSAPHTSPQKDSVLPIPSCYNACRSYPFRSGACTQVAWAVVL